jgi:hypothetical protein
MLEEERTVMQAELTELAAAVVGTMTQERLDVLNSAIAQLVQNYTETETALAALPVVDPAVGRALAQINTAQALGHQHNAAFGLESGCWVCGGDGKGFAQQAADLAAAGAGLNQHQAAHNQRVNHTARLAALVSSLQDSVARRDAAKVAPDTTAERQVLVQRLAADDAVQRTWRNVKAQKAAVEIDREKANRLSKASKALIKAGKELLISKQRSFVDAVGAYLPPGEELGVDLDTARIGLMREGALHSALSGAEWSRVLLALASAAEDGSTPCVLVPEDRAWDPDTLTSVMQSLSTSPVQIIIMSTVMPDDVDGWTIVHA